MKVFPCSRNGVSEVVAALLLLSITVGVFGIFYTYYVSGLSSSGNSVAKGIQDSAKATGELAWKILSGAEKMGLPAVGANYGTFEGPLSDLAMDWGTLIPMWFFIKEQKLRSRLVTVAPSREIELRENFEFGRVVARVAEKERKRIAFVASADQAHTHKKGGPYGFSPEASVYDRMVIDAVTGGSLKSLMELPQSLVEAAKPDSLWQMTVLAGILEEIEMRGELFSYDVPTYYGMLCAGYARSGRRRAPRSSIVGTSRRL